VARERTTKGLAKRIELTYYQRLHPFRRWWRILCIALPSAAALWLIAMAALGDQRIYTSGPVVTAHRMFNSECERCHVDRPKPAAPAAKADGAATAAAKPAATALPISTAPHSGGFFRRVSDGACLTCHDAAVHHDNEVLSLECADCHLEHKVPNTLARMSDRHCTTCHADLKTRSGAPTFEREIVSLARHPEFVVFRKNVKDATQVKLNHETHLKPDLPAGGGKRRTLTCVSCHVQDDAGKYMRPISFDLHCKECHPLEASADVVVPHQRPDIIRGFLLSRAATRGGGAAPSPAAAPGAEKPADKPAVEEAPKGRQRGGGSSALPEALVRLVGWVQEAAGTTERPPIQFAQRQRGGAAPEAPAAPAEDPGAAGGRRRGGAPAEGAPAAPPAAGGGGGGGGGGLAAVAQLERGLYEGRSAVCPYCHMIEKADPLPRIVPPKIPVRWLPHSSFDHRAHRPLACVACHPDARKSTDTADVLLPKMAVCQECHREGGGARAGCVECHLYHDRSKERSPDGPHTVPQLAATAGRSAAAPATKP
jgi:hypothetical protein